MTRQIPLSRGLVALVDDADFDLVSKFKWFARKGGRSFYAETYCGPDGSSASMHRVIIGPVKGNEVDHKSGDGLDNRRSNLRECSHRENLRSRRKQAGTSSKFKGVSRTKSGKWAVQIEQNGVQLRINTFKDEVRAAKAYDNAAKVLFGRFAKTNALLGLL